MEKWKDIEGYPVYQVSNLGRIRSRMKRSARGELLPKGEWFYLKPALTSTGYPVVDLYYAKGKKKHRMIHVLVAQAFIKNHFNKRYVNHKDGNKQNPKLDNLEWCTHKENMHHAMQVLGIQFNPPRSRDLPDKTVKDIFNAKGLHKEIAAKFGVDRSTVCRIKSGSAYSEVTGKSYVRKYRINSR